MSQLFEPVEINRLRLSNRLVRSATWMGMADEQGGVTDQLVEALGELAGGGLGLMVLGHAFVSPEGRAGVRQLGIDRDERVEGYRNLTRAVHDSGGILVAQLAHAGAFANTALSGLPALGPSRHRVAKDTFCDAFDPGGIADLVEAFGQAARRAREAGFDGVQIHAAHGYLLSQFLSPYYNRRDDEYGGPIGNRVRVVLEVLARIRREVGSDYPVLIKINCQDYLAGGLTVVDSLEVAARLEAEGIDAIEISGGTRDSGRRIPVRMGIKKQDQEAYFEPEARRFRERLRLRLILVGGIRSFEVADRVVSEGTTDCVALCRPLIREPHLARRWAEGDRSRARCLSDNLCYRPARAGEGIYCVVERRE
jgi:2,4-dienoyl-CoA reductase-like NADH-dependent reductase (Old Yellow Enzyme family)